MHKNTKSIIGQILGLPFNRIHPTIMNWSTKFRFPCQMHDYMYHNREKWWRKYLLQFAQRECDVFLEVFKIQHSQFFGRNNMITWSKALLLVKATICAKLLKGVAGSRCGHHGSLNQKSCVLWDGHDVRYSKHTHQALLHPSKLVGNRLSHL